MSKMVATDRHNFDLFSRFHFFLDSFFIGHKHYGGWQTAKPFDEGQINFSAKFDQTFVSPQEARQKYSLHFIKKRACFSNL